MRYVVIVILGLYFLAAPPVYACSCVEYRINRRAFRDARAVFIGTPIDSWNVIRNPKVEESSSLITQVKFKVERSWKGIKSSEITITSDSGLDVGMACGFRFNKGERYLIYAFGADLEAATFCRRDVIPLREDNGFTRGRLKKLNSFWFRLYARLNPF